MAYREFVSLVHKSTKRDYIARVNEIDKAEVAEKAIQFGYDYWDGSRITGYGGYRYDGRWRKVEIKVTRPGLKDLRLQTRKGYFAPYKSPSR